MGRYLKGYLKVPVPEDLDARSVPDDPFLLKLFGRDDGIGVETSLIN